MKPTLPSNRRKTPKRFFPKIKNSAKEFKRRLKEESKENNKKYPKLNALKFAISLGLVNAALVFIITIFNLATGDLGLLTSILTDIYGSLKYTVSILGAILGAIFIFLDTLVITYIFVKIYNKLL